MTYVEFILAIENLKENAAIRWIFRCLDINDNGKLDSQTMSYFYRGIYENTEPLGIAESFENIRDEIFDMVKPKNPEYITLEDLLNSENGETVVTLLIDIKGFYHFENRYSLENAQNDLESNYNT